MVKAQSMICPGRQKGKMKPLLGEAGVSMSVYLMLCLTIDMSAKIHLQHIIWLEDCWVASVGCVVGCTVVDGDASRESKACFQFILLDEGTSSVFQSLTAEAK